MAGRGASGLQVGRLTAPSSVTVIGAAFTGVCGLGNCPRTTPPERPRTRKPWARSAKRASAARSPSIRGTVGRPREPDRRRAERLADQSTPGDRRRQPHAQDVDTGGRHAANVLRSAGTSCSTRILTAEAVSVTIALGSRPQAPPRPCTTSTRPSGETDCTTQCSSSNRLPSGGEGATGTRRILERSGHAHRVIRGRGLPTDRQRNQGEEGEQQTLHASTTPIRLDPSQRRQPARVATCITPEKTPRHRTIPVIRRTPLRE